MFWPGPSADGSYAGIGAEKWEQCDRIAASTVVKQIDQLLLGEADGEAGPSNISYDLTSPPETLNVTAVYRRRLIFYAEASGPWYLYRLDCDATKVDYLIGYRDVAIFAINKANPTLDSWTLIDWQAATIYSMNQHLNIDVAKLTKDNSELEKLRDYMNFFCSFIGGNSDIGGVAAPFVMPSFDQMGWKDAWEVLECINPSEELQLFRVPSGANNADPFDSHESDQELADEPKWNGPDARPRSRLNKAKLKKNVSYAFEGLNKNPTNKPPESELFQDLTKRTQNYNNQTSPTFYALLWYNANLFAASIKINMPGGFVEMIDDRLCENPVGPRATVWL